jgi:two-component system, LytTR family, sensor kinase
LNSILPAARLQKNTLFLYMPVKKINKRLLRTALVSSPIIALYGVTPVYLFNKVPPLFLLLAGTGLMVNVLVFWFINIWILKLAFASRKPWKQYALSYFFILLCHGGFMLLRHFLVLPALEEEALVIDRTIFIAYPLISVLAINTIILIICNSILTAQKNKNAEMEIQELKVANLEAQKQVLIQQLQPHFLFNTLSVLKSLIKENPEEAQSYSVKLSEFLRYSVQVHKSDLVTLEQELKFASDYLELQKVRFENSLVCDIEIPGDVYGMLLPAYALQTLVENAIKHNSFTEKRPLHIRITHENGMVKVWNNKMLAKLSETTGTGLINLNERYKIIANKEIEITDGKDEFCVAVKLINE